MIESAFSLWNFRPDERAPFPVRFLAANGRYLQRFRVLGPKDLEPALEAFPRLRQQWDRPLPWIVRSDLARLLQIHAEGGFYFDSDCELQGPLPSFRQPVVLFQETVLPSTALLGPRECRDPERRRRIANYALGALVPGLGFYRRCLEECQRRLESLPQIQTAADVLWVCGPDVITSVYLTGVDGAQVLEPRYLRHGAAGSWR